MPFDSSSSDSAPSFCLSQSCALPQLLLEKGHVILDLKDIVSAMPLHSLQETFKAWRVFQVIAYSVNVFIDMFITPKRLRHAYKHTYPCQWAKLDVEVVRRTQAIFRTHSNGEIDIMIMPLLATVASVLLVSIWVPLLVILRFYGQLPRSSVVSHGTILTELCRKAPFKGINSCILTDMFRPCNCLSKGTYIRP